MVDRRCKGRASERANFPGVSAQVPCASLSQRANQREGNVAPASRDRSRVVPTELNQFSRPPLDPRPLAAARCSKYHHGNSRADERKTTDTVTARPRAAPCRRVLPRGPFPLSSRTTSHCRRLAPSTRGGAMSTEGYTQCPYCKEEVRENAVKCKHCRSALTPSRPGHGGTCPFCQESIHAEAIKCKHCGSALLVNSGGGDCGCGNKAAVGERALRVGIDNRASPFIARGFTGCTDKCDTAY